MTTVKVPTCTGTGQTGSSSVKFAEPEQTGSSRRKTGCQRNVFLPVDAGNGGSLGLHLSRTPWDPYPWVSGVQPGSCAEEAGVRIGDCVLKVNGEDLLGLKIIDIAKRVRSGKQVIDSQPGVSLLLWNSGFDKNNLNPQSLSRFAGCLQSIAGLLECPVCLEIIRPPSWQCCHGHLICAGCRSRSTKCPICRVMLGRAGRCLVADKLFHFLGQTLGQQCEGDNPSQQLPNRKPSNFQQLTTTPLHVCKQPVKLKPTNPAVIGSSLVVSNGNSASMQWEMNEAVNDHQHQHPHHSPVPRRSGPFSRLAPSSTSTPSMKPFCCPSGQPCVKMKNQHDILIHLQKSHQTNVVRYVGAFGEPFRIRFAQTPTSSKSSAVTCLVLLASGDQNGISREPSRATYFGHHHTERDENGNHLCLSTEPNSNRKLVSFCADDCGGTRTGATSPKEYVFFLAKFRCIEASTQALYWLWFVGDQKNSDRFRVTIGGESIEGSIANIPPEAWQGKPVSLQQNCKEVLKARQFIRLPHELSGLVVKVELP
ncbi:uncharacterized protein LOC129740675 [Uranotaenia lowii]|uniref:uncharacterized protein LOC129740675 n=1 Tax=Uranotaenia lowii TaxID=190385 RepID=UPI00247A970E|nr:uncharacterized protein LOC129740675 [Uranotaenia lowii]XP_055588394.1 uncharacterized protein LOC129740675 [Uranotaenia lowii]XP_055588395.1 uncharacterized protein LOC129740675 [Uranotaenia lowii]XP_055588396.1 uncharacterized protein LOC129740675 [Uranotaenia lowii]XP_055588397.1 uncharacterized protein LOC129740675 [Uranotaenia lowii]XP_055588398.1 uncharacterized protein LOC129740675 [Uranotaenia lowii]XP_055588399.1 uncharacterized protein LOC129740675 [Uranotaenia lowii]XP_05558840